MKKNLAKFLLLSSLVGGMAVAHPVSATTKGAIYEYRNGNLDLVQQPSYEDYESDKLILKLKTGRVDVVGARERSEESREGKSVDLGGRRIIKKNTRSIRT